MPFRNKTQEKLRKAPKGRSSRRSGFSVFGGQEALAKQREEREQNWEAEKKAQLAKAKEAAKARSVFAGCRRLRLAEFSVVNITSAAAHPTISMTGGRKSGEGAHQDAQLVSGPWATLTDRSEGVLYHWRQRQALSNRNRARSHLGMGQNLTTRGPQVLVLGSIYQASIWGTVF